MYSNNKSIYQLSINSWNNRVNMFVIYEDCSVHRSACGHYQMELQLFQTDNNQGNSFVAMHVTTIN